LFCTVPFQFGKNKELWYQDLTTGSGYVNMVDEKYVSNNDFSDLDNFYKSPYFDLNYSKNDETKNYVSL
jgi:hypothetical protein